MVTPTPPFPIASMSLNLTTQGLFDLYKRKAKEQKELNAFVASLRTQACKAIEMGELKDFEKDGQIKLPGLVITKVKRKTVEYSQAVADLKEQEEFEGIAVQRLTESFSFKVTDE